MMEGRSRYGALVLAAVLLAAGVVASLRTLRFLERAKSAAAEVVTATRRAVIVRVPAGRPAVLSVVRPVFSLPGAYRPGDRIAILYDPDPALEGALLPYPFGRARARIDSGFHLWAGNVVLVGLGLLLLALHVLSTIRPDRFRVAVRFDVRD